MAKLRLQSIVCHRPDDFPGVDEAYILVNGKKVWAHTMPRDAVEDLTAVGDIAFSAKARIDLYDLDEPAGADDHLGTIYAPRTIAGTGEHEYEFQTLKGDYHLTYEVV